MRHLIESITDSAPSFAAASLVVGGWVGVLGMLVLSLTMRWRRLALRAA